MKYLIKIIVAITICLPLFAYAAGLPKLIVCDPSKGNDCDFGRLIQLANNVIKFCIIMGISIFSIVFMYAGFLYLTAMGNTGQISKAHGLFWNAIIGFVIMLAAWLLVDFILVSLVPQSAQPAKYRLLSK